MALKIKNIFAYEVLDSRGYPTVACIVKLTDGILNNKEAFGKAMVPSGASTGQKEALELRDGDKTRYNGKGVKKAVTNINKIIGPKLLAANINVEDQAAVDQFMIDLDGTPNKSLLGANAILAVSLAIFKATARAKGLPLYKYVAHVFDSTDSKKKLVLPLPMLNVINGGEHADNTIDFQEFMFMPVGAESMHEAVRVSSECFHALQSLLKSHGFNTNKGDEGGFAPNLATAEEALSFMMMAVEKAGYVPGIKNGQVAFALDCASSELYNKETGLYTFKKAAAAGMISKENSVKTTDQMIEYLVDLTHKFPIISIEDGLDETDWAGWVKLKQELGKHVQLVGDDLFCTNPNITAEGVEKDVANSVLVKVNQIGTLTETFKTINIAKQAGWTWVLSHRSGETEDTTIADLAVGTCSGQIKTGSMSRSERIAKYNRLLEIEMELSTQNSAFNGLYSFTNLELDNPQLFAVRRYDYTLTSKPKNLSLDLKAPKATSAKSKKKRGRKPKTVVESVEVVAENAKLVNVVKTLKKRGRKPGSKNKKTLSKPVVAKLPVKNVVKKAVVKVEKPKTKSLKKRGRPKGATNLLTANKVVKVAAKKPSKKTSKKSTKKTKK